MSKRKKRGPGKPQGMNFMQAKVYEQKVRIATAEADSQILLKLKSDHLIQEVMDAAFMAASDVFQMGPGRCVAFGEATIQYLHEIAELINSDYKDDKDLVYAREKIDQRLHKICGDNFEPWEVRYGRRQEGSV